jgi:glutathione synthase/RimK-type ligase-like ATP-grasp enzyme
MDISTALLLKRGREFLELGQPARAKEDFVAVLLRDRYDPNAMLGLGEVFVAAEDFASARVVLARMIERHPSSAAAHSALGSVLIETGDLAAAHAAFVASLRINPSQRKAWCGLGVIFERVGDPAAADHAWGQAFAEGGPAISAYRGDGEPTRVLLLWSAIDGNIPIRNIFDARSFQWATLFVESYREGMPLPAHAVVFNAVGNADLPARALDKVDEVLRATTAPVINHPEQVRQTGRSAIARRLRGVPGIVTPQIRAVQRAELLAADDLRFPILVRSPGFHSGEHFVCVDDAAALRPAVASLPGDELLLIEYIDTRDPDGLFRKYRVLVVDGALYPQHLALSQNWKVHYATAEHQVETPTLDGDVMDTLSRATQVLALDYGGIDFGIDAAGRVVVFEANPTMRVMPYATDAISATQAMIVRRAGQRMRR